MITALLILPLEHVADAAEDREADDQQADQDGGDPGLREGADGGEHQIPFRAAGAGVRAGIVEAASRPASA